MSREATGRFIRRFVQDAWETVTPGALVRAVSRECGLSPRQAKKAVTGQVAAGDLAYRERFGRTVIQLSGERPVRVSPHVVLSPPGAAPGHGDAVLFLSTGAAFGDGLHPTTRLCIRGIDYALRQSGSFSGSIPPTVLDVGCGSGVLGLTALKLGMEQGMGLDPDPCAVAETRANAALNGLSERFKAADAGLEHLAEPWGLIAANLRAPTLHRIMPHLMRLPAAGGLLILSGFYPDEAAGLHAALKPGLQPIWSSREKAWAALMLRKRL